MKKTCKLILDGIEYTVALNQNSTVDDLLKMTPIELTLQRYAGHEYYAALSQKPSIQDVEMTSHAHAGGVYYYDGWSAFTVVFEDADIEPYEVVHIGDLDEKVAFQLKKAGDRVKAKVVIG